MRKLINHGLVWKFAASPSRSNRVSKQQDSPELDEILKSYIMKNAIERSKIKPSLISTVKTVPKSSGGFRLVVDLRKLNDSIKKVNISLPTIANLRVALRKGYWMGKLDIMDAFFHVEVNPAFRKYLGFRWGNQYWRFRAMPFGLTTAPAVFTSKLSFGVL